MASDLFLFDDFSLSPILDSSFDFFQDPIFENSEKLEKIDPAKFENLSIYQEPSSQNGLNFETQLSDFADLEVKIEDLQIPNHPVLGYQSFGPHSYGGAENVERFMQRSFSSNSFNGKPNFVFRNNFDFAFENQNLGNQIMSYEESNLRSGQMRRVCSTGDLHQVTKSQGNDGSPLGVLSNSYSEEANFKVGRYSAEERKERIHRYRAKRNQRNFNKTIKYACRKTLADNRARVRGRFARNDENVDIIPKTPNFNLFEEVQDQRWVEGYNEEEGTIRGGQMFNIFAPTQFQYYGFS